MKQKHIKSWFLMITMLSFLSGCKEDDKKLILSFMEMKGKGPGWGMSVIIQTPNGHTYIYDTGSNYANAGFDAGKDMIVPFLSRNNIRQIDGVLISHPHSDHFGGFPSLMRNIPVKKLYDSGYTFTSDPEYESLYKPEYIGKGGVYQPVKQSDVLDWDDDLEVEVLSPPVGFLEEDESNFSDPVDHHNPNLNSVVLRIRHKNNLFLFVGDLNSYGQEYLISKYGPEKLKTHVLCLGHGGSFLPFAEAVKPEIVVSSCLNGVEKPAMEAKEIFGQVGSKVYATCWSGVVQITSDGNSCKVTTGRN